MKILSSASIVFCLAILSNLLMADEILAFALKVPFTLQAPYSDWRQPWQDACEEATILIVDQYYKGFEAERIPKKIAHDEILRIVNIENKHFGFNKDTNVEQIVELINNFFNWEAKVVNNPSVEDIKSELDQGKPVIVPLYGKLLNNPYFLQGGPDYHTVVVKGYDNETQEFITQEPGVGRGLDYRYSYDTLVNAMHDFLPGNKTKYGEKKAIFTERNLEESAELDGDKDGLSKAEEREYGSLPWLADTDADGFNDGQEVAEGYSPSVNEKKLGRGALIKSEKDPKVFLLDKGSKRHIANETVFLAHGWRWSNIIVVSERFLEALNEGIVISS